MGTKVQCKSYSPGYYLMRDLNEDTNSCNRLYEDKGFTNGHCHNSFLPRAVIESYSGHNKDSVKQTMLEHEAIFKKQVYELHRLYRIQRDMMDGAKRKERNRLLAGATLSSGPFGSQITAENAPKWTNCDFPVVNSVLDRPSTSVAEGIHSPLSSTEGTNVHAHPCSSQNGYSFRNIGVLESRAGKVQRKLFDLQLPADEYIDTEEGEQVSNGEVSAVLSSYPRSCEMAYKNGVQLNGNDARKTDGCRGDTLNFDKPFRIPNGLADLNEPIQLEDVHETNTSYELCNGKINASAQSCKPNSQIIGFPKDLSVNSYGSNIETQSNSHLHKKGNGRRFSHVPEVVQEKSNVQSLPRFLRAELAHSSQRTQGSSSNAYYEPTFYLSDKIKGGLWKDETVFGTEISKRTPDLSNSKTLGSLATSALTGQYQVSPQPWSHSCEKPGSLNQRPISAQTSGGLNTDFVTKGSQASGRLGNRWYVDCNSRSNPAFGGESFTRNGFYQGSLSGTKEQPIRIPSSAADYLNRTNENGRVPRRVTDDGLAKYHTASSSADMKSAKGMDLNVVISDSSSKQEMLTSEIEIIGAKKKPEDHLAVFPWLRSKPICKNAVVELGDTLRNGTNILKASTNQLPSVDCVAEDCNQRLTESVKSFSNSTGAQAWKKEPADSSKLLGFPIFEKPNVYKSDMSTCTSFPMKPSENKGAERQSIILDINLPCDPATPDFFQQSDESVAIERVTEAKSASSRCHIDLNACLSDDDASLKPSALITRANFVLGIDLEAPAIPEAEENVIPGELSALKHTEVPVTLPKSDAQVQQDELIIVAAEAIVAIAAIACESNLFIDPSKSSPREYSLADPLTWFVEIVSQCGDDLEDKLEAAKRVLDTKDNEDSSEEFDHFESMILQLRETKEEDYMPVPLVPEDLVPEEAGPTLITNRPRKGQSRRGRKRRDFQRDILPGLASLSRHEVTEDLQTFGGLMQAIGHPWNSGLSRRSSARNGGGRGRRRVVISPSPPASAPTTPPSCAPLMQMLNGIETRLEEQSLTGWGKTTRRPRRQRCPAGNPMAIPLT